MNCRFQVSGVRFRVSGRSERLLNPDTRNLENQILIEYTLPENSNQQNDLNHLNDPNEHNEHNHHNQRGGKHGNRNQNRKNI